MTAVTWLSVAVLGIGSIGVFAFFIRDLPSVLPDAAGNDATDDDVADGGTSGPGA